MARTFTYTELLSCSVFLVIAVFCCGAAVCVKMFFQSTWKRFTSGHNNTANTYAMGQPEYG